MSGLVEQWNATYFDERLSAGVLAALAPLETAEPDAQALADRALRLMRMAGIEAPDVAVLTAWALGFSAPRTVPSHWSATVPPVTLAGRHRDLDEYVASLPWHRPSHAPVLLDIGCGFPPLTTMDSAARLPEWQVIGADPELPRYLVHDQAGAYASFDGEHRLRYHEGGTFDPDSAATRARFAELLRQLLPLLPARDTGEVQQARDDSGARLVRNPARAYEGGNLALRAGEVGALELPGGADVIRCMNVFMYFDRDFRRRALDWAAQVLRPGGLLLCGTNWAPPSSHRYTVYQCTREGMVAREFAFGVENVRPLELSPWYTLHDDDLEALRNAHAVATVRAEAAFRDRFDARLDALLAQRQYCPRGPDGYLGDCPPGMTAAEASAMNAALGTELAAEGYAGAAAAVLRRAGHQAWVNPAGHISLEPVTPDLLPPRA